MGTKPTAQHSLDRSPHADGNYEPGNCRWATPKQQARNWRSRNVLFEHAGERLTLSEWAERLGVARESLRDRIKSGWSVEIAKGTQMAHLRKPLAIDLFCGLGGWADGFLATGWDVIGFDIEQHVYGAQRYPAQLVIQDVLTLHGSQFTTAGCIVCSPPCQEYSYMAMPWTRAKAKAAAIRADKTGAELERLNRLFNACFRIQREASEAKGEHVPMVVENVRGAQPWVGRAAWNFGSYFLWGDVPALMPVVGSRKNDHLGGGSWFAIGRKNPGFRFDGSGRSFQSESVNRHIDGVKHPGHSLSKGSPKFGPDNLVIEKREGLKHGGGWFSDPPSPSRQGGQLRKKVVVAEGRKGAGAGAGAEWFDGNLCVKSSNSPARKAASAAIAKIPETLARHIARVYHPSNAW